MNAEQKLPGEILLSYPGVILLSATLGFHSCDGPNVRKAANAVTHAVAVAKRRGFTKADRLMALFTTEWDKGNDTERNALIEELATFFNFEEFLGYLGAKAVPFEGALS